MLFNSWEFVAFFAIVFSLYHRLGHRRQNWLLLVASYTFYGWWDWRFCSLLAISTLVDFNVSKRMPGATPERRRKLLMISLCTDLGILGFFKYFNFFVDSTVTLLGALGLEAHAPTLRIILPVGISFYTFQAMAYTIDVYREKMEPTNDLCTFAIYLSFFPQLVAGPIERAQNLIPQFNRPRRVTGEQLASGAMLVLIGLVRKMAIADAVAGEVETIFSSVEAQSSGDLLRGVLLFSLQIYGDFAGYSDMARGFSRMLGIELMENFNHPYLSTNVTVFWRRWHISLSTWLRDYLYIPLGGNRGPAWFVYRNLFLTMLLGGLWHGASWTFVVWGAIHGIALAINRLFLRERRVGDRMPVETVADWARAVISWAVTMAVVAVAWVFFRAPDFAIAFEYLSGIVEWSGGLGRLISPLPLIALTLTLLLDLPQYFTRNHTAVLCWPWYLRGVVYATLILATVILRSGDNAPFIYFQF